MNAATCLECERPVLAVERCRRHYRRRSRAGGRVRNYDASLRQLSAVDRFYARLDTTAGSAVPGHPELGSCWIWTGSVTPSGTGQVSVNGRTVPTHRFAYELLVGPIPEGLEPDHLCHTFDVSCVDGDDCPHRRCANPRHLELVTHEENMRRAHRSKNFARVAHQSAVSPSPEGRGR